jgi:hypothetical protein
MDEITAASLKKKAKEVKSFEERLQTILYTLEDIALDGGFQYSRYGCPTLEEDVQKELRKRGFDVSEIDGYNGIKQSIVRWE